MTTGIDRHYKNAKAGRANWATAKVTYSQQRIQDTATERQPSNAIGAIDHFSKKVKLRKYTNPVNHECDGLAKLGGYQSFDFWCVIKPPSFGSKGLSTKKDLGGERSEGSWMVYYNPYHANHPSDGVHLQLSDSDSSDYNGFADVIEYQNDLWLVRNFLRLDVDYGGEEKYYIGQADVKKWKEPAHITNEETSEGHYSIS